LLFSQLHCLEGGPGRQVSPFLVAYHALGIVRHVRRAVSKHLAAWGQCPPDVVGGVTPSILLRGCEGHVVLLGRGALASLVLDPVLLELGGGDVLLGRLGRVVGHEFVQRVLEAFEVEGLAVAVEEGREALEVLPLRWSADLVHDVLDLIPRDSASSSGDHTEGDEEVFFGDG